MGKYLSGYAATLVVMLAIDLVWLGVIARPFYQQSIGHLMSERPNLTAAAVFYLLYALGLLLFAVAPKGVGDSWSATMLTGAMFGFFAYATYDLTNLATLKNWPIGLAAVDMAWGTLVSAIAAGAGKWGWDRYAAS